MSFSLNDTDYSFEEDEDGVGTWNNNSTHNHPPAMFDDLSDIELKVIILVSLFAFICVLIMCVFRLFELIQFCRAELKELEFGNRVRNAINAANANAANRQQPPPLLHPMPSQPQPSVLYARDQVRVNLNH